ncbi:ribonuclease Z [Infirmifilum lucidum]|uniref:Ribonuclease Z n=1 Tax=Infirmifilum lucidum TaxID=2776706 RepID=A0A7L9FJT1_9CREN|nr:ribonuclease Z [Infirmifilum lucidum]QOJ79622.1 ribonuclease Z [Infirmifilum lucidum]
MITRIMFWGVSSTRPFKERLPPCVLVKFNRKLVVLDAGELCQSAFEYFGLSHNSPLTVLISHLHGDHTYGLVPLLESLQLAGRNEPVEIIGPPGIGEIIPTQTLLKQDFPLVVRELARSEGKILLEGEEKLTLKYIQAPHSHLSYSYVLETGERIRLNGKKLQEKAIPGKLRRKLIERGEIFLRGKKYFLEDFILERIPGIKIAYSGDTLPNARFAAASFGADVMIHESTFLHSDWNGRESVAHSTCRDAAYLAKTSRVKLLILTHYSTRYSDLQPLLEEARAVFPRVVLAQRGLVVEVEARQPRVIAIRYA